MKRTSATLLVFWASVGVGCGVPSPRTEPEASADAGGASAPPAVDPSSYTQAPPAVALRAPRVGYALATRSSGSGFEATGAIAVVGERPDAWHVELESSAYAGHVMGLRVRKEDGKVLGAVLGKPGEAGREIAIAAGSGVAAPAAGEGLEEEVTIGIGSFPSRKFVSGEATSWVGVEGDLLGVVLKMDDPSNGPYELASPPESARLDLDGHTLDVSKLSYSNGAELWRTKDHVVAALQAAGEGQGTVRMVITRPAAMTTEVTRVATDATARLAWD